MEIPVSSESVNHDWDISFHSINKKKDALMIIEVSYAYLLYSVYTLGVIFWHQLTWSVQMMILT